jgi:hypothetical protein
MDEVVLSLPEQSDVVDHLRGWHGVEINATNLTLHDEEMLAAEHRMRHQSGLMTHVHTHKGMSHL